ncbi:hypothetical protein GCM10010376_58110 [Streptomyces violaceusniger]
MAEPPPPRQTAVPYCTLRPRAGPPRGPALRTRDPGYRASSSAQRERPARGSLVHRVNAHLTGRPIDRGGEYTSAEFRGANKGVGTEAFAFTETFWNCRRLHKHKTRG